MLISNGIDGARKTPGRNKKYMYNFGSEISSVNRRCEDNIKLYLIRKDYENVKRIDLTQNRARQRTYMVKVLNYLESKQRLCQLINGDHAPRSELL
jgi:hypothetical protein